MPIVANCPNCGARIKAPDKLAGQKRACPKCGDPVLVPDEPTDGKDVPPPLPVASAAGVPQAGTQTNKTRLLVMGLIGGVLCIGVITWVIFATRSSRRRFETAQVAEIIERAQSPYANDEYLPAIEELQGALKYENAENLAEAKSLLGSAMFGQAKVCFGNNENETGVSWLEKAGQYVDRKQNAEAAGLLSELERATSDERAVADLVAMSNDEFSAFSASSTVPDAVGVPNQAFAAAQREALRRNLRRAKAKRDEIAAKALEKLGKQLLAKKAEENAAREREARQAEDDRRELARKQAAMVKRIALPLTKDAVDSVSKARAQYAAGISYSNYPAVLADVLRTVERFQRSPEHKLCPVAIRTELEEAKTDFVNAKMVWSEKFSGDRVTDSALFTPEVFEILAKRYSIDPDTTTIARYRKSLGNNWLVDIDPLVSIVLTAASEHAEKAEQAFYELPP